MKIYLLLMLIAVILGLSHRRIRFRKKADLDRTAQFVGSLTPSD
jgi:hypothetical protein